MSKMLLSGTESVPTGGRHCISKASLSCLTCPQTHVTSPQAMHSAMVLLAAMYDEFLRQIDSRIEAEERESGKKGEEDSQEEILREILLDSMRMIGKKVYRARTRVVKQNQVQVHAERSDFLLEEVSEGVELPMEGSDRGRNPNPDSGRSWESLYSAEDLRYFRAVTAFDIVQDLAAAYS